MSSFFSACALFLVIQAPDIFSLSTGAPIVDIWLEDIQGDQAVDVVALCVDREITPFIATFCADRPGSFPKTPTTQLQLEKDTVGLFFAENDGVPPRELIVLKPDGAHVFRYAQDRGFLKDTEYEFPTIFGAGLSVPRFFPSVAFDMDADGIEEWAIPHARGLAIIKKGIPIAQVRCETRGSLLPNTDGSGTVTYRFPEFHLLRQDKDKTRGLMFLSSDVIQVIEGDSWQEIRHLPVPFKNRQALFSLEKLGACNKAWAFPSPPKPQSFAHLEDFDRDGLPDILLVEPAEETSSGVSVDLYFAKTRESFDPKPALHVEKQGFIQPLIEDVDRDGAPDVVLLQMTFGPRFILNYFTSRKVTLVVDVFLNNHGTFSSIPDISSSILARMPEETEGNGVFALGDFNGDSRLDSAFGGPNGKLVVHTGEKNRFVSAAPWLSLEIASAGMSRVSDLNRDGKDDLIVFRSRVENSAPCEVVIF